MKKILLLMIVLLTACSGAKVKGPSDIIAHMGSSTVALMATGSIANDEPRPYCTGVWITERLILTANHCVEAAWRMEFKRKLNELDREDAEKMIEKFEDMSDAARRKIIVVGTPVYYSVQGDVDEVGKLPYAVRLGVAKFVDPAHDLAIVEATGNNLPAHEIAIVGGAPGVGTKLRVVGQVKGLYWSYVEGIVSAYRKSLPEERSLTSFVNRIDVVGPYLQVSAPVWYGNSGGGAFDEEGKLVGIASFLTGAPHSCYFIPASEIHALMKANGIE